MDTTTKGNHPVVRRLTFQGLKISVETDKGQVRHWRTEAGRSGETKMHYPYGYIEGTRASGVAGDGMALDVYVGPSEDADEVYVVHQMKTPDFERFDELKCLVGFESPKQARVAYLVHYDDERFLGSMETLSLAEFRQKYVDAAVEKAMMDMPPGHLPGMVVPKGGSSCSNCKFVSADKKHCSNEYWIDWRRGKSQLPAPADQYCCDMYESAKPIAQPPIEKAVSQVLPEAIPQAVDTATPAPVVPMMPPMMQGPPPIDVDTYDGVDALLGRVGGMKDQELMRVVEKIWGPGYQYINATPEHVRAEVRNFLLDQRDLLAPLQALVPSPEMSSPVNTSAPSTPSPVNAASSAAPSSGNSTSTTPYSAISFGGVL